MATHGNADGCPGSTAILDCIVTNTTACPQTFQWSAQEISGAPTLSPASGILSLGANETINQPVVMNVANGSAGGTADVRLTITAEGETEPTCQDLATVTVADTGWSPEVGVSAELPGEFTDTINEVLGAVPGGHMSIESASFSLSEKMRDCCTPDGTIQPDGEIEGTGSLSFQIEGTGPVPGWGVAIEEDISFPFPVSTTITFTGSAGVNMSAQFSISGTGGRRRNECTLDDCFFGSVIGTGSGAIGVGVSAELCVNGSPWVDDQCVGMQITPLQVSASISAGATWHEPTCDDGIGTSLTIGAVDLELLFEVGGVEASLTVNAFEGAQLLP